VEVEGLKRTAIGCRLSKLILTHAIFWPRVPPSHNLFSTALLIYLRPLIFNLL
jgi:hypothetical protein